MKRLVLFALFAAIPLAAHAAPLRVFIRGGVKTHGPNAHEHERFLNEWTKLLTERGMKADGAKDWPNAMQLSKTDVLVMYAQDGANATPEQKENLAKFTKRGGGIVVIHTAVVGNDPAWWKSVIGGAWVQGKTKWREGPMELHYSEKDKPGGPHPITLGAADFKMDDEIYYDLDMSPDVRVLAESDTRDGTPKVQAQIWTYEKDNYRAFVSIPGHLIGTFERPNYRAILLRGIAWTAKRTNLDEFCKPEEVKALSAPDK
ncbi:ThuA domain-containing protein [Luteolibacter yonseiensis]|uniref:ThuA domain-containing protein n=1 Tax=Luteolibacter yonseiensis TaxID=1144680 RepID=A0A934R2Y8_9BACT|nr:ThuA domain-containing protein [Luteolibacter yonseiensis]MBK1815862.1 ThuA domain-containing protein [Luteolibacter yonseiensis]